MEYLLGIDIGTTNCKAYAIDFNGNIIAKTSRSYNLIVHQNNVEQNPDDWWNAVLQCIQEIVRKASGQLRAIGLSSQANTLILLDYYGKPLMNAISWLDQRSIKEVKEIVDKLGFYELHNITGMIPNAGFTAPKILWLRKRNYELLKKCYKVLFSPQSYIAYKLTKSFVVDRTLASFSMLYNIRKSSWFSEMLDFIGINEEQLPKILYSYEVVGGVDKGILSKLGIKNEVEVVIGAHDQCCAALGAGLIKSNVVVDSTGTASAIIGLLDNLPDNIPREILIYYYIIPNKWTVLGTLSSSGILIDWFLELINAKGKYEVIESKAREIPPGANGVLVLPYFSGSFRENISAQARGTILGLTLSHNAYHIYRALMESIAFEMKYFLDIMKEMGCKFNTIVTVGGGAKSRLWREIKANVFNTKILKPQITDTAPLGAAILAGVGTKVFKDFKEAVSRVVKVEEVITPKCELVRVYQDIYRNYLDVSIKISKLYEST